MGILLENVLDEQIEEVDIDCYINEAIDIIKMRDLSRSSSVKYYRKSTPL